MSSCNVTKSLQENETLLVKNKIEFEGKIDNKRLVKEVLEELPYQMPNRKMFGMFPARLGIYTSTLDKKENKFRWWLKNKVGETPVVFKPFVAEQSAQNMETYLFNRGYLHNDVRKTFETKGKKTIITYTVVANDRYFIDSIILPVDSNDLNKLVIKNHKNSLVESGNPLDIDVMNSERSRISAILRDKGYFYFSRDYLTFEIDSNQHAKTAKLYLKINEPIDGLGHNKYTINNVYVNTNYEIGSISTLAKNDTIVEDEYHFIADELKYKTKILKNGIYFEKGELFRHSNYLKTKRKLASYGTFRYVDMEFQDIYDSTGIRQLDVYTYLTPAKKQSISIQIEGSQNSNGLTGSGISFTYKNRNLFKGADLLQFRISSGLDFQFGNDLTVLNNTDVTTELSYTLNRFLLPFPLKNISKNSNVKTKFTLGYQFQRRIGNYSLHSTNFSFGYEWSESVTKRHIYNPVALNFLVIPNKTPQFEDLLNQIPSLRRSFEEQVIAGSSYTFLYTNQKSDKDKSYMFFNGNIRLAGNIVQAFAATINKNTDKEKPYSIGNREYSQFARFEGDIIHHWQFARHAELATRFNAGVIIPYGNSEVSPYFQQFYAGGANSIRAFRLRALGPGSYADTTVLDDPNFFFDQSGDIKLEVSTELRFDIYKWFKGAIFADAGNVWLLNDDKDREGGNFEIDEFHKAIALGTGAGLRMDFDYFVIRLDLAFPIKDPRLAEGQQWVVKDFRFFDKSWRRQNLVYNLAIGYPF